jgi:ABC-2 type transport system permease protein
MNTRRLFAITLRYLYLLRDNYTRLVQLFVWTILDVVLWGFITKYLDSVSTPGINFTSTLLGAVVLWDFMTRAMQGVSTPFLEDIWARNLLNFFASPLTIVEYIAGLTLASILTSAVGLFVLISLAALFFGLAIWQLGFALGAFLILLFVFGISLGIVALAIVLRLGPSAEWFVWPLPTVLSPFAGVFYPVAVMPLWMQTVAHLIPASYVFEGMRAILERGTVEYASLAWAAALDIIFLAICCTLFVRVYRAAVKSGAIARYSAESFS